MLACYYEQFGGIDKVKVGQIDKPTDIGAEDVLVRVHASALNPVDGKIRSGFHRFVMSVDVPRVVGFDFSGEVVECGPEVKDLKAGDCVFGMVRGGRSGGLAEYLVVDSNVCVLKPESMTHEEAASFPLVGITALMALEKCGLKPPENGEEQDIRVLICGGAGGVGSIAIQLAKKYFKAKYVATTASPGKKTTFVQSLGADEVVNYKEHKAEHAFRNVEKFNVIFDTIGDATRGLANLLKKDAGSAMCSVATKPTSESVATWIDDVEEKQTLRLPSGVKAFVKSSVGGRLMDIVTGAWFVQQQCNKLGANYYSVIGTGNQRLVKILAELFENGSLRATIDEVFPLSAGKEASAYMESGRVMGKIVVRVVASE